MILHGKFRGPVLVTPIEDPVDLKLISASFCGLDNFKSTTLHRADDIKIDGTFDSTGVSIKK